MGEEQEIAPKLPFKDSLFRQQMLPACRPFLTPLGAVLVYGVFCLACCICGSVLITHNGSFWEQEIRYDNQSALGTSLSVTLTVDRDISNQLFVYYQLTSLYQNSFLYGSSKNWPQLNGECPNPADMDKCEPKLYQGNAILAPCGALATSIFNDTFTFDPSFPDLTTNRISLPTFAKFFHPVNSEYGPSSQWLPDIFPRGQTDERFINWMHLSALSSFRKLWAKTNGKVRLTKGEYTVSISNDYPTGSFGGAKSIVVAEATWSGAKNPFLGVWFFVLAAVSFALAVTFGVLYLLDALPLFKVIADDSWK
jgi:hypothetical protein